MENEVKQRNQRNRRRERAQRMQAQRESKAKDGDSGEDESPAREKPPRPPARRKKSKEPLGEEDIIDGFAIMAFRTYEDLEAAVKCASAPRTSSLTTKPRLPLAALSTDPARHPPNNVNNNNNNNNNNHGITLLLDAGTSDDSGRASERLTGSSVAPRDPDSSRDRLSDASSRCSSGKGYICDSEGDDDKASPDNSRNGSPRYHDVSMDDASDTGPLFRVQSAGAIPTPIKNELGTAIQPLAVKSEGRAGAGGGALALPRAPQGGSASPAPSPAPAALPPPALPPPAYRADRPPDGAHIPAAAKQAGARVTADSPTPAPPAPSPLFPPYQAPAAAISSHYKHSFGLSNHISSHPVATTTGQTAVGTRNTSQPTTVYSHSISAVSTCTPNSHTNTPVSALPNFSHSHKQPGLTVPTVPTSTHIENSINSNSIPVTPTLPSNLPTSLPPSLPISLSSTLPTSIPPSLPTTLTPSLPTRPPSLPTRPPSLPTRPPSLPTSLPSGLPTSLPSSLHSNVPLSLSTSLPSSLHTNLPPSLPTSLPSSLHPNFPPSLPTSVPSSLHPNLPSSLHPNLPSSLHPNLPTSLPSSLPTSLPSSLHTSLPSSLPTSLPPSLHTSLPSSLPTNLPPSLPLSLPSSLPPSLPPPEPRVEAPPSSYPPPVSYPHNPYPTLYAPYASSLQHTPYLPPSAASPRSIADTRPSLPASPLVAPKTPKGVRPHTPSAGQLHTPHSYSPTRERDSYSNISSLSRSSVNTPISSTPTNPIPSLPPLLPPHSSSLVAPLAAPLAPLAAPLAPLAAPLAAPTPTPAAPTSNLLAHSLAPVPTVGSISSSAKPPAHWGVTRPTQSERGPTFGSSSLFGAPLPPPPNPNPFSAESLFQTSPGADLLRRELDNRFLAAAGGAFSIRTEMHHHQHQHTHVHQHPHHQLYQHHSPFKDVSKMSPLYRGGLTLGSMGYPYSSGLLHPPYVPPAAPLTTAYKPVVPTSGELAKPPRPALSAIAPHPKSGKWNAMHVRIAWEIYNHQQKEKGSSGTGGSGGSGVDKDKLRGFPAPHYRSPYELPPAPYLPNLPSHHALAAGVSPFARYGVGAGTFPPAPPAYGLYRDYGPPPPPLHPAALLHDVWRARAPSHAHAHSLVPPTHAHPHPHAHAHTVTQHAHDERERERARRDKDERERRKQREAERARQRSPLPLRNGDVKEIAPTPPAPPPAPARAPPAPAPAPPHWGDPYRWDPLQHMRFPPLVEAAIRAEEETRAKMLSAYAHHHQATHHRPAHPALPAHPAHAPPLGLLKKEEPR